MVNGGLVYDMRILGCGIFHSGEFGLYKSHARRNKKLSSEMYNVKLKYSKLLSRFIA